MKTRLAAALLVSLAATAAAQDVLVVAPKELQGALEEWRDHRAAKGHRVAVVEPKDDVGAIVREAHARDARLRYVMLVGDVEQVRCAWRRRQGAVPGLASEDESQIATDDPWADLDGDSVPDVALGRVPFETPADVRAYLDRVVAYETSRDVGPWRRKLNVVAGVGGFGPLVDLALEGLTRQLLRERVPAWVDVSMTYANPLSPYCPPPAEFADEAVRRWNEGALVVAYVGHGSARSVDRARYGTQEYPILGPDEVSRVAAEHGAPVSVFVACSTGRFDGAQDCLAEDLLARPRGPVAVIASSRISSPYSNSIVAKETLDALFADGARTAGDLLVAMKRRLAKPAEGDAARAHLEKLGAGMYERVEAKRDADRRDHLHLYNLLGDPCLVLARPRALELGGDASAPPGGKLRVTATCPFAGTATVDLLRRRDAPVPQPPRGKLTPEDFRAVYARANDLVAATRSFPVKAGDLSVDLDVPADMAPGAATVRVYLQSDDAAAAGGREVTVAAPAPAPSAR